MAVAKAKTRTAAQSGKTLAALREETRLLREETRLLRERNQELNERCRKLASGAPAPELADDRRPVGMAPVLGAAFGGMTEPGQLRVRVPTQGGHMPLPPADNPKDATAFGKIPLELWPAAASAGGSLGILWGAFKYGRNNWRATSVKATVYLAAALRHIRASLEGSDHDPESQLDPIYHALASLAIYVDAKTAGTIIDDRNYPGGYNAAEAKFGAEARRLYELWGERPMAPGWTIADTPVDSTKPKA
jgi:hypothetical protein